MSLLSIDASNNMCVSIERGKPRERETAAFLRLRLYRLDLECIFTIICNLVKKPETLDEILEMAKLLSTKVAQQPNEKPALGLKILFNLYNLLEAPYCRFYVYMKALKLAMDGKVIKHILPSFKKIDTFLKEWDLGVQD